MDGKKNNSFCRTAIPELFNFSFHYFSRLHLLSYPRSLPRKVVDLTIVPLSWFELSVSVSSLEAVKPVD